MELKYFEIKNVFRGFQNRWI